MKPPGQPRKSRRRIVFGLAALLSVGAAAAGYGFLRTTLDRRLAEVVRAIDKQDPDWRWEAIEAARAPVPDAGNTALRVRAVARLVPDESNPAAGGVLRIPRFDEVSLVKSLTARLPNYERSPWEVRRLADTLAPLAAVRGQARALADGGAGRFRVRWNRDGLLRQVEGTEDIRTVSRLLYRDALERIGAGDWTEALRACRAVLETGRALGDEPSLAQQERFACHMYAEQILLHTLAQGTPAADDLDAVQRLLADEESQPVLRWALRGERAYLDLQLRAVESGAVRLFAAAAPRSPLAVASDWLAADVIKLPHAAALEHLTRLLASDREAAPAATRQALQDEYLAQSWNRWVARGGVNGPLSRFLSAYAVSQARLRGAVAAVAAERYRQAHGRWPATLADLVPAQLARVPVDPYDGAPFRLRRLPDGLAVYSIGPDFRDNGGKFAASPRAAGSDIGVRLWDVAYRRQEPPPAALPQRSWPMMPMAAPPPTKP